MRRDCKPGAVSATTAPRWLSKTRNRKPHVAVMAPHFCGARGARLRVASRRRKAAHAAARQQAQRRSAAVGAPARLPRARAHLAGHLIAPPAHFPRRCFSPTAHSSRCPRPRRARPPASSTGRPRTARSRGSTTSSRQEEEEAEEALRTQSPMALADEKHNAKITSLLELATNNCRPRSRGCSSTSRRSSAS